MTQIWVQFETPKSQATYAMIDHNLDHGLFA